MHDSRSAAHFCCSSCAQMFDKEKEWQYVQLIRSYFIRSYLATQCTRLATWYPSYMATKKELENRLKTATQAKNIRFPLLLTLEMSDAAKKLGITEREAYTRAARLWVDNPDLQDSYDE